jgi:hypothetical protein
LKKINIFGQGDVFLVHPENGFNSLILNSCIGGCWFTPAVFTLFLGPLSPPIHFFSGISKVKTFQ